MDHTFAVLIAGAYEAAKNRHISGRVRFQHLVRKIGEQSSLQYD